MKYRCQKCGFIHDGKMPDGYFCPLCHTNLFDFELISNEKPKYNRLAIAKDNPGIDRTEEKCINCGACHNTCQNIVGMPVSNEDNPLCLYCGQCVLTCPSASLTPKYDYQTVWELINIPGKIVVVLTSPAVKVGIGDAFSFAPGEFLEGQMVAALKTLGFDYVFDTAFGADLTAIEEAYELKNRFDRKEFLPMFSSCCPSWIKYQEIFHPNLKNYLSSCKSPIGMQAAVLKNIFAVEESINPDDLIIVALTPCTAKKAEIKGSDCDYVITTSELTLLLREQNVDFKNLATAKFDSIIGTASGTGFGASGGVTLSVLRVLYNKETNKHLTNDLLVIKNKGFYQEYSVKINKNFIKCAVVNTLINLEKLLPIKEEFAFIEVMNCTQGCVGGGGQILMPIKDQKEILLSRFKSLKNKDQIAKLKYAYDNPAVINLYGDYLETPLSEKSKKILHDR